MAAAGEKSVLKKIVRLYGRLFQETPAPMAWSVGALVVAGVFESVAVVSMAPAVELLLASRAEVNSRDKDGTTPLKWAALKDRAAIAELLLAHGADVNQAVGRTPLELALEDGHEEIVKLLLAHGAEVNHPDQLLRTPMKRAAEKGYTNIVELLRQHGGHE